jgi:hypothetical protein
VTARLSGVEVTNAGRTGIWLDGSDACTARKCTVTAAADDGFTVEALQPCALDGCVAADCVQSAGFTFGIPASQRGRLAGSPLLHAPHAATGIKATGNGSYGALIQDGVAVNLSGAILNGNGWNGLRVEPTALPGATARITVDGARVTGNGRDAATPPGEALRCGVAVEISGDGGAPRLQRPGAAAGLVLRDNAEGGWAEWHARSRQTVLIPPPPP